MAAKINNDSGKIKALMVKIKALADNGIDGEKETAKIKLNELLQKYNIKKFEEKSKKKRVFKLADFNDCLTIMTHCIIDTDENAKIEGIKAKKEIYCKLTDSEYIDVCEKFNFYFPIFDNQRKNFVKAFIIKNNLGITEKEHTDTEKISDKDFFEISKMAKDININRFKKHKLLNENSI